MLIILILSRSYYYVADVVSLFGMMPLLVRCVGLHDMTIVILAVACQVHCQENGATGLISDTDEASCTIQCPFNEMIK